MLMAVGLCISVFFSFCLLPARQKQARLFRSRGGSDPGAGDPSATISGDTVACNMLAGPGKDLPFIFSPPHVGLLVHGGCSRLVLDSVYTSKLALGDWNRTCSSR